MHTPPLTHMQTIQQLLGVDELIDGLGKGQVAVGTDGTECLQRANMEAHQLQIFRNLQNVHHLVLLGQRHEDVAVGLLAEDFEGARAGIDRVAAWFRGLPGPQGPGVPHQLQTRGAEGDGGVFVVMEIR